MYLSYMLLLGDVAVNVYCCARDRARLSHCVRARLPGSPPINRLAAPCPPWNDDVVHDYHFTVYALSVKSLDLPKDFDGAAALAAMKGKILAQGVVIGNYSQNPAKGAKVDK
jgi:phosphatidylethanolamine-binding protein (PEBP) family uncharacterized protein